MPENELEKLLKEVLEVGAQIKQLEEGKLAALQNLYSVYKKKLKKEMQKSQVKVVRSSEGYATITERQNPNTLDFDAVEAKFGEGFLEEFTIPGKKSEVFTVKLGNKTNTLEE